MMTISLYGINYNTAPIAVRERLSVASGDVPYALKDFLQADDIAANEAVILSTCNRTELYTDLPLNQQSYQALTNWLATFHKIDVETLRPYLYAHKNGPVARHLMAVASGLRSMALGETEIMSQVKTAYGMAQSAGTVGWLLSRLFQTAFSVAKQVRTDTPVGSQTLSLASATMNLAARIFSDISEKTVLFIGSGEVIQSVAMYLREQGLHKMLLAGRSPFKGEALAEQLQATYIKMDHIPDYLSQVDMVISATSSRLPLLGKGAVERALKARKHRPLLLVDLAVPRDIEPEIAGLEDVFLYNIDDLNDILQKNRRQRESAVSQAEAIIEAKTHSFMEELRIRKAGKLIKTYRQQATNIQAAEILKAHQALAKGESCEAIINQLAHALTSKLTHFPTVNLRQAALHRDPSYLALLDSLFQLPDDHQDD